MTGLHPRSVYALEHISDEDLIATLLLRLGEDPFRGGLVETPARVMKSMRSMTSGYNIDPASVLKTFEDGSDKYDEMVFQGAIPVYSCCEHHMVPFFGVAHIGYIPNGRIVGLSKLSRLVDIFSHRLQVQERLVMQIADALMTHLKPLGVGVVIQCRHLCMEMRGIEKVGTITTTSALRGCIKNDTDARSEFLSLVQTQGIKTP